MPVQDSVNRTPDPRSPMPSGKFAFFTCQVGAEAELKREVLSEFPEFKFSYSRPGFLTFVDPASSVHPELETQAIFARTWGMNVGRAAPDELIEKLSPLLGEWQPDLLHLYDADRFFPGDEPESFRVNEHSSSKLAAVREALDASGRSEIPINSVAPPSSLVLHVIAVPTSTRDRKSPSEWWFGLSRVALKDERRFPGARPSITVPENAPSRAYVKFSEARMKAEIPFRANEVALEIGCTPGGTLLALLELGLEVWGIDPNPMDADLLRANPERLHFVRSPMEFVDPQGGTSPRNLNWLMIDVNVSPDLGLPVVERFARANTKSLHGAVLTLKLMNWDECKKIPDWLNHVDRIFARSGIRRTLTRQLAYNRQEFCVVGMKP
jgi:23S rRNA C2498 (ribose-2'-O)-methylase RlmM